MKKYNIDEFLTKNICIRIRDKKELEVLSNIWKTAKINHLNYDWKGEFAEFSNNYYSNNPSFCWNPGDYLTRTKKFDDIIYIENLLQGELVYSLF